MALLACHFKLLFKVNKTILNKSIYDRSVINILIRQKQTIVKKILHKNMILWQCLQSQSTSQACGRSDTHRRPLTLIFSWINSKDKDLEKYKQLWFKRGFDVLTVKTSLADSLLPQFGSKKSAKQLVEYLPELMSSYDEIVVHTFSVGGYKFGEVLIELNQQKRYLKILKSIKGVVMDSLLFATDNLAQSASRALTKNSTLQSKIYLILDLYFNVFRSVSLECYRNSETMYAWNPPLKYPGLIFYSRNDIISDFKSNENLVNSWQKSGNSIRAKCWDQSPHILHYRYHKKEYEQELDDFIKSLRLKSCRFNN